MPKEDFAQNDSLGRSSGQNDFQSGQGGAKSAPHDGGASFAPSKLELPKGGGAVRGLGEKYSVSAVTGTVSFSLPLPISSGRSGFEPQLHLAYDSGSGNGPFGIGWHLALAAITRKTDKGLPQYSDWDVQDVFVLADAEDLVPVLKDGAAGTLLYDERSDAGYIVRRYRPRVEGAFARIERWFRTSDGDVHWRTLSRDNVLVIYGKNQNSRVMDPHDPSRVFSWLIAEARDDRGNALVYEYKAEDATGVNLSQICERNRGPAGDPRRTVGRYVKQVRYGNRISLLDANGARPAFVAEGEFDTADWAFTLVFDYGEHDPTAPKPDDSGDWLVRNDPFSCYRASFERRTYRLCQRVLMFHQFPAETGIGKDCLVRSLDLTYRNTREDPQDGQCGNPLGTLLASAVQYSYLRNGTGYRKEGLPPLEFEYSDVAIQEDVQTLDDESLAQLPAGLDGHKYAWMDFDGEGLSGILTQQGEGWYYKRNRGGGRFSAAEPVARRPSIGDLGRHSQQWLDIDGDGRVDLVEFEGALPGFTRRESDGTFAPYRPFAKLPKINWQDPNLRLVDLDGDGIADVLITEQDILTWHRSEGITGFGEAYSTDVPSDEERGPSLLLEDSTQSIFLADMSGDGLTDLVRVRNGEVSYWPNIGYGRFGARVVMDASPWFDRSEQFDTRRIRLADIDGTGCADIVYLGVGGVTLYFNQMGNAWSAPRTLTRCPMYDNLSTVTVVDLLGNGTACLVWSSSLPGDTRSPLRYIDLAGGKKPNFLVRSVNNLGAETQLEYASSTSFYIADREAGRPWITRLPFPVQVVTRLSTFDRISRNRFVSRYAYHHGYFDAPEREFRGFSLVEQFDTEELGVLSADGTFPDATNIDATSYVPPVYTKTWFHTGAFIGGDRITHQLAAEYYRESTTAPASFLPDSTLPGTLSPLETREAVRALKGSILRSETYALDGTDAAGRPYAVSENNYIVTSLQSTGPNPHAVFFVHPREAVSVEYDRTLYPVGTDMVCDPRVSHSLVLATDSFGNELQSATVTYGRRHDDPDPALSASDRAMQRRIHVTASVHTYTNAIDDPGTYHTPLQATSTAYEAVKTAPQGAQGAGTTLFTFADLSGQLTLAGDGQHDIAFEDFDAISAVDDVPYRRPTHRTRVLYRRDDLTGPLPLGVIEPLTLPYDRYTQVFTAGLLKQCYVRTSGGTSENLLPNAAAVLAATGPDGGGYVDLDGSGDWWAPSTRVFFNTTADPGNPALTAAAELVQARTHFFQPRKFVDAFGNAHTTDYDGYDLLGVASQDAMQNVTTALNDYRVLQPWQLTDCNGNISQAAFNTLGMVVGAAVIGKNGEGDTLDGFVADLTAQQVAQFFADPHAMAGTLLAGASKRTIYDINRYATASGAPTPVYSAAIARETHVSDLKAGETSRLQVAFSYSDGFGREIQRKAQAEPGPLQPGGPTVDPRWVTTGWKVFNNKGAAVRGYEPFFDDNHDFRFGVAVGVSPVLFYDPLGRNVATLHANHCWEKVVFDPWRSTHWDVNDTSLIADPKTDADVGIYFARLLDAQYLPTWYAQRATGTLGQEEKDAANKAAAHAATPAIDLFDTLGRNVIAIVDNGPDQAGSPRKFVSRVSLDIDGNHRQATDALGRVVMVYTHDMRGTLLYRAGMEDGGRWSLNNVSAKLIRAWDTRGNYFRTVYDALERPAEAYFTGNGMPEVLFGHTIYGESVPVPEVNNLRGRIVQVSDQAGILTTDAYDFKGNLQSRTRQFAADYKSVIDWSNAVVPLESNIYSDEMRFDAMDRPIALTTPDGTVVTPHFNEAGLLDHVEAVLADDMAPTVFVSSIDYDAKGQRTHIAYGNGAETFYDYDPQTFRLMRLQTFRDQKTLGAKVKTLLGLQSAQDVLQDLSYTYDAASNVVKISDVAQQTIYFRNKRVEPSTAYTYDALYRLVEASGREHLGLNGGGNPLSPTPPDAWNAAHVGVYHPSDGTALGLYAEQYVYDAVGNILSLQHRGSDPVSPGWTRSYGYNEPSLLEPGKTSNRLSRTTIGLTSEVYQYAGNDGLHGNITSMSHLPSMQWDCHDQLRGSARQIVNEGTAETTWYVYDGRGQRVRKVTDSAALTGQTPVRSYERIYLGAYEIYREYAADGVTATLERQTLHISDDHQRLALVESRTLGSDGTPARLTRYQFHNHIGSAALELDDGANIISYEEYFPFGSTSYEGVDKSIKAAAKRYRYLGKERDEENGFLYVGARYYAAWLGRWTNCDPNGVKEGPCLYAYAQNRPISMVDPDGRAINLGAAVVGAGIGALVGGGIELGRQLWTRQPGQEINWKRVGTAAAGGGVAGFIGGLTMGGSLLVQAAGVGGGAAVGGVLTRTLNHEQTTGTNVAVDVGIALVTFGIFKGGGAALSRLRGVPTPEGVTGGGSKGSGAPKPNLAEGAPVGEAPGGTPKGGSPKLGVGEPEVKNVTPALGQAIPRLANGEAFKMLGEAKALLKANDLAKLAELAKVLKGGRLIDMPDPIPIPVAVVPVVPLAPPAAKVTSPAVDAIRDAVKKGWPSPVGAGAGAGRSGGCAPGVSVCVKKAPSDVLGNGMPAYNPKTNSVKVLEVQF